VLKCLCSKCEALSSNPSTAGRKEGRTKGGKEWRKSISAASNRNFKDQVFLWLQNEVALWEMIFRGPKFDHPWFLTCSLSPGHSISSSPPPTHHPGRFDTMYTSPDGNVAVAATLPCYQMSWGEASKTFSARTLCPKGWWEPGWPSQTLMPETSVLSFTSAKVFQTHPCQEHQIPAC
jgi:hypothetical protein